MTVAEIAELVVSSTGELIIIAVILIASLIEISPIKINPLSWVAKQIGRAINGEVLTQVQGVKDDVDSVKTDLANVKRSNDEFEARTARRNILHFGDDVRRKVKHSKEHFDDVLQDITDYEQYCRDHPEFKNQITVSTIELIKRAYDKCLEENDFL